MGQVLHGSATTSGAVGRAIQHSQESLRALSKHYGINPKTVGCQVEEADIADLPAGPKEPRKRAFSVIGVTVRTRGPTQIGPHLIQSVALSSWDRCRSGDITSCSQNTFAISSRLSFSLGLLSKNRSMR